MTSPSSEHRLLVSRKPGIVHHEPSYLGFSSAGGISGPLADSSVWDGYVRNLCRCVGGNHALLCALPEQFDRITYRYASFREKALVLCLLSNSPCKSFQKHGWCCAKKEPLIRYDWLGYTSH